MTDFFSPIQLDKLLRITLKNLDKGHYFGIRKELFYIPRNEIFETKRFGKTIQTPIGPAAGPHTQLSQNIVGAWLCGARYIELKTIQTLDEIEVAKPCIDVQDEGYNCEWSQELKIKQSFEQYLDAWILIHILNQKLNLASSAEKTIFNMSVGYDLKGILNSNVQWFFDKMNECSAELNIKVNNLSIEFPWVKDIKIPSQITNNITLSTMHGCPPDEIEKIGLYLIKEKNLHTVIKLNPTLLGPKRARKILNSELGYKTPIPDQAFEHDLKYEDALNIINNLQEAANIKNLFFGLKVSNTLECINFRKALPESQKQMYMSGKALHPLAINLAELLRSSFPKIDISFSAGADCFNICDILSCNLGPVTISSDLLKPGGYGRLSQYLEKIEENLNKNNFQNISELMNNDSHNNLLEYSKQVIMNNRLKKSFRQPDIKTKMSLDSFDCIHAPCINTCPGNQNIPQYLYYAANKNWQEAFEIIMLTNPFPNVTGNVCDHQCQTKCTRINYDDVLAIRDIKKYVASFENNEDFIKKLPNKNLNVSIIGAGPAGLSCAWYLRLNGFNVTVYEEQPSAGGMVKQVIPSFRLSNSAIEIDIKRIQEIGVNIIYNSTINSELFEKLRTSENFVFIAIGANKIKKLGIKGEDAIGVLDPLDFLKKQKENINTLNEAKNIIVLGGGNTAMDVARAAKRISKSNTKVSVVYRRTINDMPAVEEEINDAILEGVEFKELLSPVEIISENNKVKALKCNRMIIDGLENNGRQIVKADENNFETIEADVIIPAIGQQTNWNFVDSELMISEEGEYKTKLDNVYIGGDAKSGASNIISAIADGKKVAESILKESGLTKVKTNKKNDKEISASQLMIRKARREYSEFYETIHKNLNVNMVNDEIAQTEASRCLFCDEICNICVTVCPNFANQSYEIEPCKYQIEEISIDAKGILNSKKIDFFEINQKVQTFNIVDFCNECGNCNTFCPTSGAPYKDKPKLHLSEDSWNNSTKGYLINLKNNDKEILYKNENNEIHKLKKNKDDNFYTYEICQFKVKLNSKTLVVEEIISNNNFESPINTKDAIKMHILLDKCAEYYHN